MAAENFSFFFFWNSILYSFSLQTIYLVGSKLNRDKTIQNLLKVSSLSMLLKIILPLVWIKIKSNNFETLQWKRIKFLHSEILLYTLIL